MTPIRRLACAAAALGCVALIGWADLATGIYLSVSPFYLLPVAAASWWLGPRTAAAVVVVATFSWFLAEYGWEYEFPPMVSLWNGLCRAAVFAVVARLILGLRERTLELAAAQGDLAAALAREQVRSRTDALTGLANRRGFLEALDHVVRSGAQGVTVACVDLDDFKTVNDLHGHAVGDSVLQHVAAAIVALVRDGDVPARLGGDEFAVLFVDTPASMAELALQRLQPLVRTLSDGLPGTRLGVSVGVVYFPAGADCVETMLEASDRAMYQAKAAGKGRIARAERIVAS